MFIVWGKKIVHRKLGYVADFCPICRDFKCFELKRVGSAGHVYGISSGEGELVGFERTCTECATILNADPTIYASFSKKAAPLPGLLSETFPNAKTVLAERLAIEEKIKSDPRSFSGEERKTLIRSPFLLLSPKVERRFASTHLDKEIVLSIIGALALLSYGPGIASSVVPKAEIGTVALSFIVIGLALVVWQVIASGGRFMRKQILPPLATALKPLNPTESELSFAISELRQMSHRIGKRTNLVELQALLAEQPSMANG